MVRTPFEAHFKFRLGDEGLVPRIDAKFKEMILEYLALYFDRYDAEVWETKQ
jgi:hypothetical protein